MPSNAEDYFNQILSGDPVEFLTSQANGVFEEEWLDFKGQPKDDSDALKLWGKAVTGFSNTEGGVLVWGIDAREKADTKVDCSCGLNLIKNPLQFLSLLTKNISTATTPPTNGIQIKTYLVNDDGHGFVVCFIPEGKAKPYRSGLGDKYYFIRSGTSFNDANPALLRLMFFPKSSPDLQVQVRCDWDQNSLFVNFPHRIRPFTFKAIIENAGLVSAENIYMFCTGKGDWKPADARFGAVRRGHFDAAFWYPHFLNPAQTLDAVRLEITSEVVIEGGYFKPKEGVTMSFMLTARDIVPRKYSITLDADDLTPGTTYVASMVG